MNKKDVQNVATNHVKRMVKKDYSRTINAHFVIIVSLTVLQEKPN